MGVLNIATGTILILLGMRYVRKGLDRLFGSQLVDWLQQMTQNRYQAFLADPVAGVMAPSSSAIAMLSVHYSSSRPIAHRSGEWPWLVHRGERKRRTVVSGKGTLNRRSEVAL